MEGQEVARLRVAYNGVVESAVSSDGSVLGGDVEGWIGRQVGEILRPESWPGGWLGAEKLVAMASGDDLMLCKGADGSDVWVRCVPEAPEDVGAWSGALTVVLRDATKEALQRDTDIIKGVVGNLIEAVPGAAIVVNESGMMVVANEEAARIFRTTVEHMQGGYVGSLVPMRARAHHHENMKRFLSSHQKSMMGAGRGRLFGVRSNGEEFEIEVDLSRMEQGDRRFVMCAIRDVAERRRLSSIEASAESANRASEAKTAFLTRMSHELRTPLNAVLGFGQLLEMDSDRNLTVDQQRYIQSIMKAGRHLLAMITDLMDISRIEAGAMGLAMETLDAYEVISESVAMASTLSVQKSVAIQFEARKSKCLVEADKLRLRQVLVNLLTNAIKYNRFGGSVSVVTTTDRDTVVIAVRDTGRGMSAGQMAQLFQAFNRLGAEADGIEGIGMGLVISRSLVEQMGGALKVGSVEGVGSTFEVRLKRGKGSVDQGSEGKLQKWSLSKFGMENGVLRAVYVEDNEANRELMRQVMKRRSSWDLKCVKTADEAIEEIRRQRPDLLIVDMHLPDMHGVELVRKLELEPATASIPRVGLSADSMESTRTYAMSAGFARYFTKPLDVKQFVEFIDKLADGSSGWDMAH